MITLKITMQSGKSYNIRNFGADNVSDFVAVNLVPFGTELKWYEVLPGIFIKVSQIESIRELSEEEIKPAPVQEEIGEVQEVVFDKDKENVETVEEETEK